MRKANQGEIWHNSECSVVVWRESVWELDESACENPMMTFPFEKRINTELFIDRPRVREGTNECDQPVALTGWRNECILGNEAILISKCVGMRDQVWTCLEMSLTGMWKKLNIVVKMSSMQNKEKSLNWADYAII